MSPLSAYTKANIGTSSAPQIMIALFQAALRNMRVSAGAFSKGDYQTGSVMAEKAAAIVLGLQGTLKPEIAPELCEQLSDIYTFVACRLGMAGAKFSAQHVLEAEQVFTPIAEAFVEVVSGPSSRPNSSAAR